MTEIQRDLKSILKSRIGKGKIIILIGPCQVGKTTLFKSMISEAGFLDTAQYWNCDESDVRSMLTKESSAHFRPLIGKSKFIVIDEAQRVKNIGLILKILYENFQDVQFAVTSSSSLDLSNTLNEPLTGRKFEYNLFPFSTNELVHNSSMLDEIRQLETRLVYGFYPDVVNNPGDEKEILSNIVSNYLYKDVFEFQDIRKPAIIEKLVQALALQVGSEVSFNEIGRLLGIDTLTVQRYIDLLEKAFVIFHLHSYSRNVRNELKKSIKIYFYDNGVRNAVINNFSPCNLRADIGGLWENFLISERIKNNAFHNRKEKYYFWRTTQKQEIDFIEEKDGVFSAFEFKYSSKKSGAKCPLTFSNNYPEIPFSVITKENYIEFITEN